jgi:hypothetical protein
MIIRENITATAAPLIDRAPSNTKERRFQLMKLSQSAASVNATSGVLEPVAITAANMITIAGTLSQSIWRRLLVMLKLSQ